MKQDVYKRQAQELAQLTNRFLGGSCKIEHMHIANKEIRL